MKAWGCFPQKELEWGLLEGRAASKVAGWLVLGKTRGALVAKSQNRLRGNACDVAEHDVTWKESNGSYCFDGIGGVSTVAGVGTAQRRAWLGSRCARGKGRNGEGNTRRRLFRKNSARNVEIQLFQPLRTRVAAWLGKIRLETLRVRRFYGLQREYNILWSPRMASMKTKYTK